VTIAKTNPINIAGSISCGIFHPIKAPPKQSDKRIPVLFTAPSSVILSDIGISPYEVPKFLVKAGFADLPNLFIAACFDIKDSFIKLYTI
jgi:hypothetical protein